MKKFLRKSDPMTLCWQKFVDFLNGIFEDLGQLQMAMNSFLCMFDTTCYKQTVCMFQFPWNDYSMIMKMFVKHWTE